MARPRHNTCAVKLVGYKNCPALAKRLRRGAIDLSGKRYGRLRVLCYAGHYKKTCSILWLCQCDCGERAVLRTSLLRHRNNNISCGCNLTGARKHGHTRKGSSTTYRTWQSMKSRCLNPNVKSYQYYGARGIKVCPQWLGPQGFKQFLADMGLRPHGKTLDRREVNGNYEPKNCRWATDKMQNNNKRPRTVKGSPVDIHMDVANFSGIEEPI